MIAPSKQWPLCKCCTRRSQYWTGDAITWFFKKGKITAKGIRFLCSDHVPNPSKWFWLQARDVRSLLQKYGSSELIPSV